MDGDQPKTKHAWLIPWSDRELVMGSKLSQRLFSFLMQHRLFNKCKDFELWKHLKIFAEEVSHHKAKIKNFRLQWTAWFPMPSIKQLNLYRPNFFSQNICYCINIAHSCVMSRNFSGKLWPGASLKPISTWTITKNSKNVDRPSIDTLSKLQYRSKHAKKLIYSSNCLLCGMNYALWV